MCQRRLLLRNKTTTKSWDILGRHEKIVFLSVATRTGVSHTIALRTQKSC